MLQIYFCFTIHKKLNRSCSLNNFFLFLKKKIVSLNKTSFEILWSEVWKEGFQLMLILGLLGMYFDAAVVFVTNSQIFLRLAVAIQWLPCILTIELHFQIPFGNTATIAAITTPSTTATNIHRFCGRYFSTISDDENSLTVCSKCLSYQYF